MWVIISKELLKANLDVFKDPKDRARVEAQVKRGEESERSCKRYYQFTKIWGSDLFEDPIEKSKKG
jgi:hypothetical protein